MRKIKRNIAAITALVLMTSLLPANITDAASANRSVNVTISVDGQQKAISPYIYGINDGCDTAAVTAGAIRQGGNRYTAYNWETNYSNAGSDWYHNSDTHLSSSTTPGQCAINLDKIAKDNNIPFTLATLQMAGYVAADRAGQVSEAEAAPSSRWNPVEFAKGTDFALSPDLTDGVVYMDEYVNYLVNTLGNAANGGISAYSLDNEPALWSGTHARIVSSPITCDDLISRSISLASAVKNVDPTAQIFGPALYGFSAFVNLQSAPDWTSERESKYKGWFIAYYLEQMAKAERTSGKRLLDVLDIHYYSSDAGSCGSMICNCTDMTHTDCIEARLQAARTLWDPGYIENSWIGQWFSSYLPILPNVQKLIDDYYPETKLAISEYNFGGGNHISGAIAEVDALGTFGLNDVYFATLWPLSVSSAFPLSAINLYTNYDGAGSSFGNISIPASSDNIELTTAYASIDSDNSVHCIFTNKSLDSITNVAFTLTGAEADYSIDEAYMISGDSSEIVPLEYSSSSTGTSFSVNVPALSAVHIVFDRESTLLGDVNRDGSLQFDDYALLKAYLHSTSSLSNAQTVLADIDSDGIVCTTDALLLKRILIGEED